MTQSFVNFVSTLGNLSFVVTLIGLIASFLNPIKDKSSIALVVGGGVAGIVGWLFSVMLVYAAWGILGAMIIGFSGPIALLVGPVIGASNGANDAAWIPYWYAAIAAIGFYRASKVG